MVLQLVCAPSPNLMNFTDVAAKYPGLMKTAAFDTGNQTGVFATDLTLAQIRNLTVNQTAGPARDQSFNGLYQASCSSFVLVPEVIDWVNAHFQCASIQQ